MEAILEAAARLFDRGSATTNAIARLAGVSIGSLYEYFPNKDAILDSLVEGHVTEAVQTLRARVEAMPPETTPLEDGVRGLIEATLELHADRPGLHRSFIERMMGRPGLRRHLVDAERQLRQVVEAWLRVHPDVSVPDIILATRMVVEGVDALVHRHVEDAEGVSVEDFVDELTRLCVGYLRG